MSGPWEKYQTAETSAAGPWTKYAAPESKPWSPTKRDPKEMRHRAEISMTQNPVTRDANMFQNFAAGVGSTLADLGMGAQQIAGYASQEDADIKRETDAALRGNPAGAVGSFAGGVALMAAPALNGAKMLPALGKGAAYAGSAITGATYGGLQPVGTGESRLLNTAAGATLGVVGQKIANVAAARTAAKLKAGPTMREQSIADANDIGIPLNLSQTSNNKFLKILTSASRNFPLAGNPGKAQQESFMNALAGTINKSGIEITPQMVDGAFAEAGGLYNKAFSGVSIPLGPKTLSTFGRIQRQADQFSPEASAAVKLQLKNIIDRSRNGAIEGKTLQAYISDILKPLRNDPSQGFSRSHLAKIQTELNSAAASAMGPQKAAQLKEADRLYRNTKSVEKALTLADGASGNVLPSRLWGSISKKYGATPEIERLARIGQNVLKDPIQDSGTAQRQMATAVLSGAGLFGGAGVVGAPYAAAAAGVAAGGMGLGSLAGRVLNSPIAPKVTGALGQGASKTMNGLARLAPSALPALAPVVAAARDGGERRDSMILGEAMQSANQGPEIIANMSPQAQVQAITQWAERHGQPADQVAARVKAEAERLDVLMASP